MAKKKHPGGRPPTRYNPNYHPLLIELLARQGCTDKEAAEKLGICKKTLDNWKIKHKEFLHSIKKGKNQIDDQVENALLRRALGFEKKAIKIFHYQGKVITHEYNAYYPPEVGACCFWLKNRRRDKWKDRWDINMSGGINLMEYDIPVPEEEMKEAQRQLRLFLGMEE